MVERGVSTKEEFLDVLYKSKPWNDAKMLAEFKAEDFLKDLSEEKTKKFIEEWDETLKSLNEIMGEQGVYKGKFMEPVPTTAKKDPYLFFKFFENRFQKKSEGFKRKAYRLYDVVISNSVMTENEQKNINYFLVNRIVEKWSKKYKKSINCSNPKGFSQKAHCAARKKRNSSSN
jgi:hypothetical protein